MCCSDENAAESGLRVCRDLRVLLVDLAVSTSRARSLTLHESSSTRRKTPDLPDNAKSSSR